MFRAALIAFMLAASTSSPQALSMGAFNASDENARLIYLRGAGEAFDFANVMLMEDGKDRLYCAPEDIALSARDFDALVRSFVLKLEAAAAYPVEFVLLLSLQETYPCFHLPANGVN